MATENQNLSEYNLDSVPKASALRIALLVSEWNNEITDNLLKGAKETLEALQFEPDNLIVRRVPGAYELPIAAQFACKTLHVDAVICLGSVVRGETSHFDYVCQAVAQGVKDVSLKFDIPVVFGILTDDTMQQGLDRSGGKHGNKGVEAAVTAVKMAHLKINLGELSSSGTIGF